MAARQSCHTASDAPAKTSGEPAPRKLSDEQGHVLGHQGGVETGIERAGEHAADELFPAGGAAAGRDVDDVQHGLEVEALGQPEQQSLGGRRRDGGRKKIVEQLERLALARSLTDVEDIAGNGIERRPVRFQKIRPARPT